MSNTSQLTSNQHDDMILKIMLGILAAIMIVLVINHFRDRSPIRRMPFSAPYAVANWQSSYTNITPQEVKAKMDAGEEFTLVDIRGLAQYNAGHIAGAISIPLKELAYRYNELDPREEIIVYCQIGVTSVTAAQLLVRSGFPDVKNMVGGISEWQYGLVTQDSEQLVL
jgi:rhodanese-related sulfurtransferase